MTTVEAAVQLWFKCPNCGTTHELTVRRKRQKPHEGFYFDFNAFCTKDKDFQVLETRIVVSSIKKERKLGSAFV